MAEFPVRSDRFAFRTVPVSYTHLDVYKRQAELQEESKEQQRKLAEEKAARAAGNTEKIKIARPQR